MAVYLLGYAIVCSMWAAIFIAIAYERHTFALVTMLGTMICVAFLAGSESRAQVRVDEPMPSQASAPAAVQSFVSEPGDISSPSRIPVSP